MDKAEAESRHANAVTASEELLEQYGDIVSLCGKLGAEKTTAENAVISSERRLLDLKAKDITVCSECGQAVDSSHTRSEIEKVTTLLAEQKKAVDAATTAFAVASSRSSELATKKAELTTLTASLAANIRELVAKAEKISGYAGNIAKLEARVSNILGRGQQAKAEHGTAVAQAEKKIDDLKTAVAEECKVLEAASALLAGLNAELSAHRNKLSEKRTQVSDIRAKASLLGQEKKSLEATIAAFEETSAKVVAAEFEMGRSALELELYEMACATINPKDGLPIFLLDVRLPELQDSINRYMREFGIGGLQVELATRDDEGRECLEFMVDNGVVPRLPLEVRGGGYTDIIELCFKFSLADIAFQMRGVSLGLAAFDEPVTSLAKEFKNRFVEILHERCAKGLAPVTLMISHDQTLVAGFQNVFVPTR